MPLTRHLHISRRVRRRNRATGTVRGRRTGGGDATHDGSNDGPATSDALAEMTGADGDFSRPDAGAFECDERLVTCGAPSPTCPPFQHPVVSNGCWTGDCVAGWACRSAVNCAACTGENYVCAIDSFEGGFHRSRCEEVPPECFTRRTCDCLRIHICKALSCSDQGNGREFGCFCLC
jgi:hypothetical protein